MKRTPLRSRLTPLAALVGLITLSTATASADIKSFHGSICQENGDTTSVRMLAYDWYGVKVHEDAGVDLICPLFRDRYGTDSFLKAAIEIENADGGEVKCWLYTTYVTGAGNFVYDYSLDSTTSSGFVQLDMPGYELVDVWDSSMYAFCSLGDNDVLGHIHLNENNNATD